MRKLLREAKAFYPEYLLAHDNTINRILHSLGATLFFVLTILAFISGIYWLIAVAIFAGYAFPGIGHRFFEQNESFRSSKPVLCVICALKLYIDTITFRKFIRRGIRTA